MIINTGCRTDIPAFYSKWLMNRIREGSVLSKYGLKCNGYMSQEIIEKSINCELNPPKRKNLRTECNCLMGNDIGAYNTCGHLCKYCYANANKNLVINNMKKHDENSPFLIGGSEGGDKITEAKQKSWISFFSYFSLHSLKLKSIILPLFI